MALLQTLTDDFDDSSFDTGKWTSDGFNVTLSETDTLNLVTGTSFGVLDTVSINTFDLTGSYFAIKLLDAGTPFNADTTTSFYVYSLAQTMIQPSFSVSNNLINFFYTNEFGDDYFRTTIAYSSAHQYVKLRESGGTLYWDTSPDGITYTNQASYAVQSPVTDVKFNIRVLSFGGTASTVKVRYLNHTFSSPCVKLRGKCKLRAKVKIR